MLDDFIWRATLAGILVAMAAAPLGCFVVWRRMAYFGDATAHAAILGVALALMMNISILAGVLAVALLMASCVSLLSGRGVAMDTLLGVMAHSALAIGLVAVSFLSGIRVDLNAYLFGDILAVGKQDLGLIAGGTILVLSLMAWRWSALLTATMSEELAHASGIQPRREQLVLTVALAIVVAVALKVVGALLIAAMLIIPAATARPLSRSPEGMALIAGGVATVAVAAGLKSAYVFDTPTGPTIVSVAALMFVLSSLLSWSYQWVRQ
ncbi:metal ABC transporter permease [Halomonas llamarensis]|uniref:High-affinity zinc uptake system membrane protein ZnuB n=1 Tax=Halomonas llamarensis TaxID=2945104 RepID=A0ABT0SU79_9GAMM|nr:metal ABC transporter permease [Halomonas llamarensis]MCL7931191.1 metal ABC transporter permease [Halomonas llamarensis]